MSFMLESAAFAGSVMIALAAALGLLLVLFLVTTIYLGANAARGPYPILHFFSEALFPAFKILLCQLTAFLIVVFLVGLVSISVSCVLGCAVVAVIAVVQIYFRQKQIHVVAESDSNIWNSMLFGIPSAITPLLLLISTACVLLLLFTGATQGYHVISPKPHLPNDVDTGRHHHANYMGSFIYSEELTVKKVSDRRKFS